MVRGHALEVRRDVVLDLDENLSNLLVDLGLDERHLLHGAEEALHDVAAREAEHADEAAVAQRPEHAPEHARQHHQHDEVLREDEALARAEEERVQPRPAPGHKAHLHRARHPWIKRAKAEE